MGGRGVCGCCASIPCWTRRLARAPRFLLLPLLPLAACGVLDDFGKPACQDSRPTPSRIESGIYVTKDPDSGAITATLRIDRDAGEAVWSVTSAGKKVDIVHHISADAP